MLRDVTRLEDLIATSPALTDAAAANLRALFAHPAAPRWYQGAGDRLTAADGDRVRRYAADLATQRGPRGTRPAPAILAWARDRVAATPLLRRLVGERDVEDAWESLPTTSREDLARHAELLVPDDAELGRMIVYRTAGSTGHALRVPSDPVAVNGYLPLIQYALERWGVRLELGPERVSHFLVGHQTRTVSYPASFSYWNGAGFAKLNLHPDRWRETGDPQAYFDAFAPQFLAGDPLSFAAMQRSGLRARPHALLTTAVAMSPALKELLQAAYGCPVIDWYSLTETGPLAYACPLGHGYHWLPHDVHLETLDEYGQPTSGVNAVETWNPLPLGEGRVRAEAPNGSTSSPQAQGAPALTPTGSAPLATLSPRGEGLHSVPLTSGVGEITVTGGRNPFLPLFRYRTGDWGRLDYSPCPCGDPMPRLLDLEGREPVQLEDARGQPVNPVDVARLLREFPVMQHQLEQRGDCSVSLVLRPVPERGLDLASLRDQLARLFGGVSVTIRDDPALGETAKVIPYRRVP